MQPKVYDVAVIGAGPAGLKAATVAAQHALTTVLFDERGGPGGQSYRAPAAEGDAPGNATRKDRRSSLASTFRQSGATAVFDATVWAAHKRDDALYELGVTYGASTARSVRSVHARAVIIATGALERPFPIPGWTLPGVIAAGATGERFDAAETAGRRIVFAGTGPLLWLLASRCLDAGADVLALLDTTPRSPWWRFANDVLGVARSSRDEGGGTLRRDVRRRVRVVEHVSSLGASGPGRFETVRFAAGGGEDAITADCLLLHQGVVPDINLGAALGCGYAWHEAQACFHPIVDAWGGSTLPDVFFAGDAAGVAGADVAEARGHLAALAVANALGRIDAKARDSAAGQPRAALQRARRGRVFIDSTYRPADEFRIPRDDTIVCRCEEVSADQVLAAVRDGAQGPNQVKAFARCGMGPCQGRYCGVTLTELIAQARKLSPDEVGHFRLRWPAKPITLGELAALERTPEAERAVVRPLR